MKNFYKNIKSGFTLVELMIIIAIISILFVAFSQFNIAWNISQEKATRLAESIHDILRDAKNDMIIWKAVITWSDIKWAVKRVVTISKNNIIVKWCHNDNDDNNDCVKEKEFEPTFDGDSEYKINSIKAFDKRIDFSSKTIQDIYEIDIQDHQDLKITFSNNLDGSAVVDGSSRKISSYLIEVEYKSFKRYIYWDVLTGNVTLFNRWDVLLNPTTP